MKTMTIEEYKAEEKAIKELHRLGFLKVGEMIRRMYDLKARYVQGKGSWLLPV